MSYISTLMSFQTISSVNYISGLFYCYICYMLQNKHYMQCVVTRRIKISRQGRGANKISTGEVICCEFKCILQGNRENIHVMATLRYISHICHA